MTTVVAGGLGAMVGVGVYLVVAGLRGRAVFATGAGGERTREWITSVAPARVAAVAGVALVVLALTGWIAGSVLGALAVVFVPRVLGGGADRRAAIARTEAIAAWTEMIRDSIAAASGLEEAIFATASVAPAPIRAEVVTLVTRLEHQSLPAALGAFGAEVAHPSADMVVAALSIAARTQASDLTGLLSRLAESIRDDARMRIRVDVSRTRVRTAARVVAGVLGATIVALTMVSRSYLAPYDSPAGQVVLVVVGAIFALGGWLLVRMAELDLPERFTARVAARR